MGRQIKFYVTPADHAKAESLRDVPGQLTCESCILACAFARSQKKRLGSMEFGHFFANDTRERRFRINKYGRRVIRKFDRKQSYPLGGLVILSPV